MPEPEAGKDLPVRVALRCRPLITKELTEGCQKCLIFVPNEPQVIIGNNKSFTYDYVFDPDSKQSAVYEKAVSPLVEGIFQGYNATVLAYGQTGSGKTHTMGSGYCEAQAEDEQLVGVIPRTVKTLFNKIQECEESDFTVKVSYLEVYNEDINDLLSQSAKKESLPIREDNTGGIRVQGLEEVLVAGFKDTMSCLEKGSVGRTTGSTAMNATSSRSHAIFTMHIEQRKKENSEDLLSAKFHLVDLAGSERAKRTHAEGERFKEGININKGLLALGNVISALGDENNRKGHVPYRDAKLTRLLQDSLGGNSQTLMIACVSPADSNLEETINTLRYADRARQIKNKPIVNRDPTQAELSRLRQQVQQLQVQLLNKGGVVGDGVGLSGDSSANVKVLVEKNKALESENRKLSSELQSSVDQTTHMCEKAIMAEMSRDKLKQRLDEIKEHVAPNLEVLNSLGNETENENILEKLKAVKEIQKMILELDEEESEVCNDDLMLPAEGMEDDENATPLDKELLLRRAEMGRQLQELNNALAMKQELASAMGESDEKMSSMKVQYEETMKQLESEITSLQQEKDELAKALHEVKNNTVVSKISEQRRRRLQELEGEMSKLKKKLAEHSKLIKFKEQGDQKIKKLNSEIQVMKQTRVKLMKQMKQDTTKFQQFKTQKDREVMKLKQQDRKRQHEVVKLERQNQLQQNMLRRKAEEASAANKRLKEALHKRKIATDKKEESFAQSDMKGTGQRVRNWLSRELEVLVCMGESRRHLEELLADRKTLSQQLSELEQSTDEPAAKKRASMNDTFVCDDSLSSSDCGDEEKKQKIFALKHELQLRSAQIADLQEKLMDADQEEKSKHRWSNIRSIVEAKCGLKWLLNTLVESKVQNTFTEAELTDSKVAQNECRKEVEEMKDDMENIRLQHQQEITELQKMNEDKVLYLLKELNQDANTLQDTDDSEVRSLKERLQFQESQIAELNAIHEKFQQVSAENELLKKQLAVAKYQKDRKLSFLPELTDQSSVSDMKTVKNPTKIKKKKAEVLDDIFESEDESWESDEDDSEYTYESDSSWCETPIKPKQRRRTKIIDQNKKQSLLKVPTGCSCKGNCRGRCGCTKSGRECDDTCRCDDTKCLNKDGRRNSGGDNSDNDLSMQSMSQSQLSSTSSICLNSTFLASPDNPNENKPESPRKALKDVNTGLSADPKNIKESGDGALKKESFKKPGIFVKRPKPDDESAINSQGVISKKKRKLLSTSNKSYFKPPQV